MSAPTTTQTRPDVAIGERVELARYTVCAGERIIYGQRIDGVVRITDRPASDGTGRSYLVERELEQEGPGAYAALQALLADYLAQASVLDRVPMASSVVGRHYLEALEVA